jgi:rare lipoprotein A (peptidoglycan hydrolase)
VGTNDLHQRLRHNPRWKTRAAAICCLKASPRYARWLGSWYFPAKIFRKGIVLLVSFRASGSAFDGEARTAAQRRLPFGTKVRVINVANEKSVVGYDHRPWTT